MKNIFMAILVFLLMFSCKTIVDNSEKNVKTEKNEKSSNNKESDKSEHDVDSFFELDGFEFAVDRTKSVENGGIYDVMYGIKFYFKTNKYIILSFKIYDMDNNVLFEKSGIKTGGLSVEKKDLFYVDGFKDKFSHSLLLYSLNVEINRKSYEFTGEYENTSIPSLSELKTGPVITRYENKKTSVSLYVDIKIGNCLDATWIHLIPPSALYYWSLLAKTEDGSLVSNSIISDTKHINYIDNGTYILQINLGAYGIIQKEFHITDYLDNKSGPNYGMPLAGEKNADKNTITLDMDFIDKADYVEITLFSGNDKNAQKLGTAKFTVPSTSILKKELFEMFFDDNDNRVKLKYNKKYFYRITVYSKEFNSLKYISISDPIPITFQGFSLFGF